MENTLKIKYFGVPTIEYNNVPIKFPMKKLEALVFYVGYYKKAERTELVNLLWCDKGEQTGRKNLRNALYKLKSFVDVDLIEFINDQVITINSELKLITDLPSDAETLSEKVLKLDFLRDFHVKNAEEFDDWITMKRNQYQGFYSDWLVEKYQYHLTLEDVREEKKYLKLLIEHDPYNEPYYRELMRMYQKERRYNKGIDLYRVLVELLDTELGISPDAQTEELYRRLLLEKDAKQEDVDVIQDAFFGRESQLKKLMNIYRMGSQNDMILIKGEAGIGKTRLKDEFLKSIRNEVLLVESQSYQMEPHYYLKPWSKILDAISSYIVKEHIELPDNWTKTIRTVFPNFKNEEELGSFLLKEQTDVLKYPEIEDAVVNLFDYISSYKKIVIGLEDLQWMDRLSMDLLKGVLIRCRIASVVVIATLRLGHSEYIDDFIMVVNRTHPVSELHLDRFTESEVGDYIESVMPKAVTEDVKQKIYKETEGNTGFMVEYVKNLKEGRALPDVLDGMRDLLRSRIMEVGEEGKKLLNIMSMFFDEIPFELLNRVSSKNEFELIELIEDLKRRNLIREVEQNGRLNYQFIHNKIREYLYRNQSTTAKRIFHLKIADLLEQNLTGEVKDRLIYPYLIYNYSKGGNLLKSIRYKINNAHTYLDFSHELIPENHHLGDNDKASMVISNDMTMELIKDIEETIDKFDVIDLSTDESKEIILEFYHIKGRYYIREGLYDKGFESIEKALNLCYQTGNYKYMMNCYLQQIYLCIQTNDLEKMKHLIDQSLGIIQKVDLSEKYGTVMRLQGLYYLLIKDFDQSLEYLNQSIALVEASDQSPYLKDVNIAVVYNYMGELHRSKRAFEEARGYFEKAIAISDKHGIINSLSTFYTNYAKTLFELDKLDEAKVNAKKAIEIFNFTGISWRRSVAENVLVLVALREGLMEEALAHYDNGIKYALKIRNPYEMGFMYRVKCEIYTNYNQNHQIKALFHSVFEKKLNEYIEAGIAHYERSYDGYEKEYLLRMKKN
ncbi:MAG: AAA family ATPase [Clostridia bacterium]|nr:AAA family ATPase [Clostridia bacterium]